MRARISTTLAAVLCGAACETPVDSGGAADLGVVSVTVQPRVSTVRVQDSVQLSATIVMSNNRPPSSVTWTSSNAGIATANGRGVVRAVAPGNAYIIAVASANKRDSAAVTVVPAAPASVASVAVTPTSTTLLVGGAVQLTATPKDANGNVLAGRAVTWSTSALGVATVSGSGLVTAVSAGTAAITATSEGQGGTAAVTVSQVPVASVVVSPATVNATVGQSVQLAATPRDANGNVLTARAVIWSTSAGGVATVSTSGLVVGVAAGTATMTATSEGKSGTAAVTVNNVPVASVTVNPPTASLIVGQAVQLSATLKDANGSVLNGRSVTW